MQMGGTIAERQLNGYRPNGKPDCWWFSIGLQSSSLLKSPVWSDFGNLACLRYTLTDTLIYGAINRIYDLNSGLGCMKWKGPSRNYLYKELRRNPCERRSPISIAAAVIYIITQLSEEKKPLRDISLATGVAEGTIRNAYKDLYPHISRIIPVWYAKEEDLKNLCSP
ncbi:hypothetical protein Cgig2_025909 [Carnegiea gigantea]|uniref:Transcription factor TFIIB cyclin-like domain-containing protein n=1 Tax=Carnegiea gigantea TaxID=171969 RepID=A0A9Q1K5K1_9CARY|nr:hypothetical protein Cgig2_025909 [Carnegiea gigantea]